MTKIDFYQIENQETVLGFSCRLIEKIYRDGREVYVLAASLAEAEELDALLWTFRPDRFIPHALTREQTPAPVLIGHDGEPSNHHQVLVNLSGSVPDYFSHFERVAEVVPPSEDSRESARRNYKFYKDRGYPLDYHKMKQ